MYFFILSFQLHNKTVCNLILQPLKLQELCDNSIGCKYSYYMLNNKEPVGLIFNSKDKKNKISPKPFSLGTRLHEVRLN